MLALEFSKFHMTAAADTNIHIVIGIDFKKQGPVAHQLNMGNAADVFFPY